MTCIGATAIIPRSTGVISMLMAPLRLTLPSSANSNSASRSLSFASASSASCLVGWSGIAGIDGGLNSTRPVAGS